MKRFAKLTITLSLSFLMMFSAFPAIHADDAVSVQEKPVTQEVTDNVEETKTEKTDVVEETPAVEETVKTEVEEAVVVPTTETVEVEKETEKPAKEEPVIVAPVVEEVTAPHPAHADDATWTQVLNPVSEVISTFAIQSGNESLTGHLGFGNLNGGSLSYVSVDTANYYITDADGNKTTYTFRHGSMSSTFFREFDATGADAAINGRIASVWTREVMPGYTQVQARSKVGSDKIEYRVTMTPERNGEVKMEFEVINLSTTNLERGFIRSVDTELNGADYVPVYSLGTGNGVYIDNSDDSRRVYFRSISTANNGPDNYLAGSYYGDWRTQFGSFDATGDEVSPSNVGDVLVERIDSAVLFKWNVSTIAVNSSKKMVYAVGLGDDAPIHAPVITSSGATSAIEIAFEDDLDVSGTWRDFGHTSVAMSYTLDGNPAVSFGTFTGPVGNENPWNLVIDSDKLSVGEHTLTVTAVNESNQSSNVLSITFTVKQPLIPVAPVLTLGQTEFNIVENEAIELAYSWIDNDSLSWKFYSNTNNGAFNLVKEHTAADNNKGTLSIPTTGLAVGTHTMSFKLIDDQTLESNIVSITINVAPKPIAPVLNVKTVEYAITEGENINVSYSIIDADSAKWTLFGKTDGIYTALSTIENTDLSKLSVTVNTSAFKAGTHTVLLKVVDDQTLESNVVTITVKVAAKAVVTPPVTPPSPTLPATGIGSNTSIFLMMALVGMGLVMIDVFEKRDSINN